MPGETRHEQVRALFVEEMSDDAPDWRIEGYTEGVILAQNRDAWAYRHALDVSQQRAWEMAGPNATVSQSTVSRILREMDRRIFTPEYNISPDMVEEPDQLAGRPPIEGLDFTRQDIEKFRDIVARYVVDRYALYRARSGDPKAELHPELEGRFSGLEG
jgi:hypothetical protein